MPTCHDVNVHTASPDTIDVLIGFCSGDVLWMDPVSMRYSRINKAGQAIRSPVRQVRWVPGSETLFVTAHENGCIYIWDRENEDAYLQTPEPDVPRMPIRRAEDRLRNPMSAWRVARHSINDMAFSPDAQKLAVVADDGLLRVIDVASESVMHTFKGYFGAMLCVCWSTDGCVIATGGQDDLVTLWAPSEKRVIAHAQGHSSFVSRIVTDPWRWNGDAYRFVSVGEDANICLWDFSPASIRRQTRNVRARRYSMDGMQPSNNGIYETRTRALVPILHPTAVVSTGDMRLCDVRLSDSGLQLLYRNSKFELYARPRAEAEEQPAPRQFGKRT